MAGLLNLIGRKVDDLIKMGYPKEVAERISSGALDPSTQARMARFAEQGYIPTYHGTTKSWGQVDPSKVDIGIHSGTQDQAKNRLKTIGAADVGSFDFGGTYAGGSNTMPLMVKAKNPLEMSDVGQWENAQAVAERLMFDPKFSKNKARLEEIYQHMDDVLENSNLYDNLVDMPDNRAYLDEIREMIQDKGYDSVRYLNEVENEYGKWAGYTQEAQKQLDDINNSIKSLEAEALKSRPKLPTDPAFLDEWLNWKPEKSPEIDALKAKSRAIMENPANQADPYSYITLDPNGVRSAISGMADPEYTGSNILGSRMIPTAGAGVLGALAAAQSQDSMANPIADLRASEAQFGMTPQERAISDLRASENQWQDTPPEQRIQAAEIPWMQDTANALRKVETPWGDFAGQPFESTANSLDRWAYGEKPDMMDKVGLLLELGTLGGAGYVRSGANKAKQSAAGILAALGF